MRRPRAARLPAGAAGLRLLALAPRGALVVFAVAAAVAEGFGAVALDRALASRDLDLFERGAQAIAISSEVRVARYVVVGGGVPGGDDPGEEEAAGHVGGGRLVYEHATEMARVEAGECGL